MKTLVVVVVGIAALLMLAVPFFASLTAWEVVLVGLTLSVVVITSVLLAAKWRDEV